MDQRRDVVKIDRGWTCMDSGPRASTAEGVVAVRDAEIQLWMSNCGDDCFMEDALLLRQD